jgi:selenide,water dikinase
MNHKLTAYSKGSGCGCKLSPEDLRQIIQTSVPGTVFPGLLVGNDTNDDAAVFDLGNGTSVISTVDFFTPLVDDAAVFGSISACNAISDIYAMGGKPLMAVAILGWPVDKLPLSEAQRMLDGARGICTKAGIPLAGGHSIESTEPFFGLAVTGTANTQHIKKNSTALEGDLLFITKPIGIGILSAALKKGIITDTDYNKLVQICTTLNTAGETLAALPGITAMTDITGFGLLGHLYELCNGSALGAEINLSQIPLIEHLDHYMQQLCYPDITTKNYNTYKDHTTGMNGLEFMYLCDPQSSGGLLVAVSPEHADTFTSAIAAVETFGAALAPIGKITAGKIIAFV